MKITIEKLKSLSYELYGMGLSNPETKEFKVITEGLLKQSLDLKSKHFLNKFAKVVTENLPEEENEELLQTEIEIIDNLPSDLFEKVGAIQTKEDYPVLMDILFEKSQK